jgi:hypothetical protein
MLYLQSISADVTDQFVEYSVLVPLSIQYVAPLARNWKHKHHLHHTVVEFSVSQEVILIGRALETEKECSYVIRVGSESFCKLAPGFRWIARI